MIIGIDISQIVYKGTGVGRYVEEMVKQIVVRDSKNKYVLFGASLRQKTVFHQFFLSLPKESRQKVTLKILPIPPSVLTFFWNTLHIFPIEWIVGTVDIFWSSDWTQPPLIKAKGITTIHDLTIIKYPESFSKKIIEVHTEKLMRSKQVCSYFLCDSEATKKDAYELLQIPLDKMTVVYPGYNLSI